MVRPIIVDADRLPPKITPKARRYNDYTGLKVGMLTVLYTVDRPEGRIGGGVYWLCRCDCGNHCILSSDAISNGHMNKSCGCLLYTRDGNSKERMFKHYRSMVDRCMNPESESYKAYHNQFADINVCDEWMESYDSFREWSLSHGYQDFKRLYRIDETKGFCPENCVWESRPSKSEIRQANRWFR